ncbi:MAG: M3 family peptidase, partial [Myxococcales bacterium]|nr:M3 family peptidase [Myxococcales bacterium]
MIRLVLLAFLATGCKKQPETPAAATTTQAEAGPWAVLTREWEGPYGGVPPLDQVKVEDFEPALQAAMASSLVEIRALADAQEPPTVENMLIPWERSGGELSRVMTAYGAWTSTMSSPEVRELQAKMSPVLSAHFTKIWQDPALYARFEALSKTDLTPVQRRIVDDVLHRFALNGVALEEEKRARVAAISEELAGLYDTFSNNLLA